MKRTTLIGILSFVTLCGCNENKKAVGDNEFVLKGELEGIENESWIYLMLNEKIEDSTKIENGEFSMKGYIEHPKEYNLMVKNSQNYSRLWLESGEIMFQAKDGEFDAATISGSDSQKESEKLWKPIWEYRKKRDSLSKIVYNDEIKDSLKIIAKPELKKVMQNRLKIEREFIRNNPQSFVSASTLDLYSTSFSNKTVTELYNNFDENVKNSVYGKSIKRFLELYKNPQIGDPYIDFSMTNENDELVKLSDFDGKLILLDFWASWCRPCIEEYPALKKAYSSFKEDGFEIVSISQDQTKKRWLKSIEENELNWVNLWEEEGRKADPYLIYGISGIPDNFLIDKNGIIVARNLRGENLIQKVKEVLE
ncbi:TlpA disulfide reductase family protein [Psychroflexus tropicus]|uniref:TlpA disulfide reductase family protein n=1 Tax=Psychroflexus tropicus TaxID=197345 RepID=UPI0003796A8C|nr:TlpA disulfide reductase family protein [Psychroflexus tropicus]